MDEKKKKNTNNLTLATNGRPPAEELCPTESEDLPHMIASASSPSLLTGCGDPSTPSGSRVERHIHAHHVHNASCVTSPDVQNGQIQIIEFPASPSPPTTPVTSSQPQGSHVLTPLPPRQRNTNTHPERPNSAPPHHLERISGVLLRLVGDHYLCLTCGRELRNVGDQLALETNLRRAFSSSFIHYNLEDSRQGPN